MSFVPEDRLGMGLVGSMGMTGNMMLRSWRKGKSIFLDRKDPEALAQRIWQELEVVTPSTAFPVRRMSGGNVQKVLVGREIAQQPSVLMTAYAVRGLDINTSYTIYNLLTEQKMKGVAVEAFKTGAFDLRTENEAKKWVSAYNGFSEKNGLIKAEFSNALPSGMQGFVFNSRRPLFKDRRVRQALGLAFDFEWSNKNLFYGLYKRTQSFFDNSELAAKGLPKGEELKILNEYRDELPDEVFNRPFASDKTAGDGNIRPQLEKAFDLLEQAGWTVDDAGVLTHADGTPFIFEILIDSASSGAWQRIILPYVRNLKRLGITAVMRAVDATQYKNRIDHYDYDMIVHVWGQSTSPGNEQRYFWGSKAADKAGAQNYAGIKNRVVDALIEKIVEAADRRKLIAAVKALDRVLLWEYHVVPHWHVPTTRLVYWNKFGKTEKSPMKGVQLMTWWIDQTKLKNLNALKNKEKERKKANAETVFKRLKEWF